MLKRTLSILLVVFLLLGTAGCVSGGGETEPIVTAQPTEGTTGPAGNGEATEPTEDVTEPGANGTDPDGTEPEATVPSEGIGDPTESDATEPTENVPSKPGVIEDGEIDLPPVPVDPVPTDPVVTGPVSPKPPVTEAPEEPTEAPTDPTATKPAPTDPPATEHVHNYTHKVVKPTCTKKGYTKYTCDCGDSYKGDYVDKLPHNYFAKVVEPSCTRKGYTKYTCECGDSYKGDYVEKLPHSYATEIVKPTCEDGGYTQYTCSCGESYKGDYTDELGHDWTDWTTLTEATYYNSGEKQRTCKVCEKIETEFIAMLKMPVEVKQQEVLRLVNEERAKAGVAPLEYFFAGQEAGDIRAEEISTLFSHNRPDGTLCWTVLADIGIEYFSAGENIAFGYTTPVAVMEGWMNSDGHRVNILDPGFTHLIVGVNGTNWVQIFLSGVS